MPSNKERFYQELARITGEDDDYSVDYPGLDDAETVDALVQFAHAINPDRARPRLRKPRSDGTLVDVEINFGTGKEYLQTLRLSVERGFDLLDGTVDEYNDFMLDLVDGQVDDYDDSIGRTTAKKYQSAARAFYRFCDEPGKADERPDTSISWPANDIHVFSDQSEPRYDEADLFTDTEVDALREGCLRGRNPRRDRAFLELLAGTVQRIEAIRTLRVRDVETDPDEGPPYLLLNPEIKGEGDKDAIENSGRWKPIVSNVGPIREFIRHHPLRDAETRAEHGCPDAFEDCYLFVGDPTHPDTDASRPWDDNAIRKRLERLAADVGVDKPVKPHNFRHWAYSKSKELPVEEDRRRKVFGWASGSTTGDKVYGHVEAEQAGREFAEAWTDAFGDSAGDTPAATEQLIGGVAALDLPPEARQSLVQQLVEDDAFKQELLAAISADG